MRAEVMTLQHVSKSFAAAALSCKTLGYAQASAYCITGAASIHCACPCLQALWGLYTAGKLGPNVTISNQTDLANFKELVRSSKFCFAPWGHGWGNRLGLYMVMGCVPVIVQVGHHAGSHMQ